jgi:hypothetical protein
VFYFLAVSKKCLEKIISSNSLVKLANMATLLVQEKTSTPEKTHLRPAKVAVSD